MRLDLINKYHCIQQRRIGDFARGKCCLSQDLDHEGEHRLITVGEILQADLHIEAFAVSKPKSTLLEELFYLSHAVATAQLELVQQREEEHILAASNLESGHEDLLNLSRESPPIDGRQEHLEWI